MTGTHENPQTNISSRRHFLKTSATLASGAALSTLAVGRTAHAGADETIRIGMIGCGGRCTGAAAESLKASRDVKLVAMYDVFEDRALRSLKTLQTQFPDQVVVDPDHVFSDFNGYRKVIDSADAVMIACASKFHPMYAEAAIKAGKHVFVEKPHGIDPVGVRRMEAACELARQKGVSLLSGLQSRFHLGWQETVKRIHDGAIGEIVAMQSMFLRGPYRLEGRDPKLTETQYQFSNWYHFLWLSGDDVPQSLVHNIDRMCWILQEASPTWAFGLGGRSASYGDVYGDMYDHDTVVYEFPTGTRLYALCRTQKGCYGNAGDIVMGSKGICDLARCRFTGPNAWQYEGPGNNPYETEQAKLVEAIKTGQPINSGYHMNNATLIGVMGQIACYSGVPVQFEAVRNSDLQYGPGPDDASFETKPPCVHDKALEGVAVADRNYPLPMPGTVNPAAVGGDLLKLQWSS